MKNPLTSILAALLLFLVSWTVSAAPASISFPSSGSTLTGSAQTFQWNDVGASLYQVWIGNTVGTYDIGYYPAAGTSATSTTVTGLPADGRTLYVRLWSNINGAYQYTDTTFTATWQGAELYAPAPGSTLPGSPRSFQWNDVGASLYQLWFGNSVGAYDAGYFPAEGTPFNYTMVSGLPNHGRTLYARLWSYIGGTYYFKDFTYTASAPRITSPQYGSTLTGSTQTFQWDDGAASLYQVWVGNSLGAYDIGYYPANGTTATSTTVSGLPGDGRQLYVRLWSRIDKVYQYTDTPFTAAIIAPPGATISSPVDGATLSTPSQTFTWNDAGASLYQLFLGSSPGTSDIGYYPTEGTTGTSVTVDKRSGSYGPRDGHPVYARLYSRFPNGWVFTDKTFKAPNNAEMISPASGSTLTDSTQTFQWSDAGASLYQVWIGNSVGAYDIGYYPAAGTTATSTTVTGLPTDGRPLYVRLWTNIDGVYGYTDATFTARTATP